MALTYLANLWSAIKQLFADDNRESALLTQERVTLSDHERRLLRLETKMTTLEGDVTELETVVPALIARDQKAEKDLATAQGLVTELTQERDTALANAASPDTIHRLDVLLAALQQFQSPPVTVAAPVAAAPVVTGG